MAQSSSTLVVLFYKLGRFGSCYEVPCAAYQKLNRAGEGGVPSVLRCFHLITQVILQDILCKKKNFIWKYLRCTKRHKDQIVNKLRGPNLQLKKENVPNTTKGSSLPLPGFILHLPPGDCGHAHFGVYHSHVLLLFRCGVVAMGIDSSI